MTPLPALLGVADLAERWDMTKRAVMDWTLKDGFPVARNVGGTLIWAELDIDSWEAARKTAGLPLPGERRRGPEPRRP